MKKCNTKCCLISVIAVLVFFFLFDLLVHGKLMQSLYETTADVWRPMSEMKHGYGFLSNVLLAVFSVCIISYAFCSNCENSCEETCAEKSKKCPIMLGSILGLFVASMQLGSYCWLPVPFCIVGFWMLISFLKFTGAGLILKILSKKSCNKITCDS